MWRVCLTFDLALWPTDLNINRDHLLIKEYLPTKCEASGAKRSWVISCARYGRSTWPLTLTFDLLTWKSKEIIYFSRTIYLPSLKLLGQSIVELSVAQCMGDQHHLWPWPFHVLTWISIGIIYSSRTIYLPSLKLLGQSVISCTRLRKTDIRTDGRTDGRTDRRTCATQYALLFKGGHKY